MPWEETVIIGTSGEVGEGEEAAIDGNSTGGAERLRALSGLGFFN